MLKTNHDTAGCPRESQGGTPQHNLTYPCAEFNLQNTTVQLGGWFRVKETYLCSSLQLWIFNFCYCCRPSLQNRVPPASACGKPCSFRSMNTIFWRHPNDLLNPLLYPPSGQGCFPCNSGEAHNSAQWKDSISIFISNLQLLIQICCNREAYSACETSPEVAVLEILCSRQINASLIN